MCKEYLYIYILGAIGMLRYMNSRCIWDDISAVQHKTVDNSADSYMVWYSVFDSFQFTYGSGEKLFLSLFVRDMMDLLQGAVQTDVCGEEGLPRQQ